LETGTLPLSYCPSKPILSTSRRVRPVRRAREHMFVMRRRTQIEFESAMTLMEAGCGDSEIERLTGIPSGTVSAWRHGRGVAYHRRLAAAKPSWRPNEPQAYCYLLGAYLGDGCIAVFPSGAASLVLTLDSSYPGIIGKVERAMSCVLQTPVSRFLRMAGSVTALQTCHPALPYVFPQHGRGRKHTRAIRLTAWQRTLTERHPEHLIRGLIHSDGCRVINRFKTKLPSGRVAEYAYPRYFFSNLSADIRQIFCEHCDLLDIRWTQSNSRNISVSHRRSVARLDEFVGPKS
jgi:hypothetical protein